MRARLVAVAMVLVLLAVACGKDKKESATVATTSAPTATTATTASGTPRPSTGSDAKLDSLVFVASDFPSGWASTPPDTSASADDDAAEAELNACVGTSGKESEVARKQGNDFSQGETAQAGSEANTVKDDATYRRDVAALKTSKVSSCIKEAFTKLIQKEVPNADSVEVSDLDVPHHGDVTLGRRLTVTATSGGQTGTIYFDIVLMGKNRREVSLTFFSLTTPFEAALQKSLVDKVGARLDAV